VPRRPSAKQREKAHERFKATVTDFILGLGARPGRFYDHELNTPAGLLHLTVHRDWLACRFDDVLEGAGFTASCHRPCNPYSGKWNFHFHDDPQSLQPESVLPLLKHYFERLMTWQSVAA